MFAAGDAERPAPAEAEAADKRTRTRASCSATGRPGEATTPERKAEALAGPPDLPRSPPDERRAGLAAERACADGAAPRASCDDPRQQKAHVERVRGESQQVKPTEEQGGKRSRRPVAARRRLAHGGPGAGRVWLPLTGLAPRAGRVLRLKGCREEEGQRDSQRRCFEGVWKGTHLDRERIKTLLYLVAHKQERREAVPARGRERRATTAASWPTETANVPRTLRCTLSCVRYEQRSQTGCRAGCCGGGALPLRPPATTNGSPPPLSAPAHPLPAAGLRRTRRKRSCSTRSHVAALDPESSGALDLVPRLASVSAPTRPLAPVDRPGLESSPLVPLAPPARVNRRRLARPLALHSLQPVPPPAERLALARRLDRHGRPRRLDQVPQGPCPQAARPAPAAPRALGRRPRVGQPGRGRPHGSRRARRRLPLVRRARRAQDRATCEVRPPFAALRPFVEPALTYSPSFLLLSPASHSSTAAMPPPPKSQSCAPWSASAIATSSRPPTRSCACAAPPTSSSATSTRSAKRCARQEQQSTVRPPYCFRLSRCRRSS